MKLNKFGSIAGSIALVAAHGLAVAGPISYSEKTCTAGGTTTSVIHCAANAGGTSYGATVTAWSAQNTGTFKSASMTYYAGSGIGIHSEKESSANPQHAMDNNGATEAILVNFGSANFALDQVSIGWRSGDADVSILRYTGASAPLLTNSMMSNLKSTEGWEWMGDFSTLTPGTALSFNNTGEVKTASWWLISAYNTAYSGQPSSIGFGNNNDYFKLSGFGGSIVTPPPPPPPADVPEPGTFALVGIALLGFAAARRKSKAM